MKFHGMRKLSCTELLHKMLLHCRDVRGAVKLQRCCAVTGRDGSAPSTSTSSFCTLQMGVTRIPQMERAKEKHTRCGAGFSTGQARTM